MASRVDGVEIDDYARELQVELTSESVTVRWLDIAHALGIESSKRSRDGN